MLFLSDALALVAHQQGNRYYIILFDDRDLPQFFYKPRFIHGSYLIQNHLPLFVVEIAFDSGLIILTL